MGINKPDLRNQFLEKRLTLNESEIESASLRCVEKLDLICTKIIGTRQKALGKRENSELAEEEKNLFECRDSAPQGLRGLAPLENFSSPRVQGAKPLDKSSTPPGFKGRNPLKIAGYFAHKNEIDLIKFYQDTLTKYELYFPRFDNNEYLFTKINNLDTDITNGKFNIREPKSNLPTISLIQAQSEIDLWLVPGIVFDINGHRIGFGRGYYDLFLAKAKGYKIGICFPWQIIKNLPVTSNDIKMDLLIH